MKPYSSLNDVQTALNSGKTTCAELVNYYIKNIEAKKHLNAFLEVFKKDALAQAQIIDDKIKNNTAGKLAGLVIGIKDNICYKGHHVSASSKILEGFESIYSATVVEKLLADDAIIIGRLNCDEFAMGSSNENSAYGKVLNPLDENKVPGGSSGGSAVAVAADLCLATLGSDTGGSIRQPASFCGVVGFKPTYGRVSRYGLIAYGSSFDQIGPITNNVADAAKIMEVIAGQDEYDSTVSTKEVEQYSKNLEENKKVKIAYLDILDDENISKAVRNNTKTIIEQLKNDGHTVAPVEFPYLDYLVPAYYVLTTAEASSNLARYDGVHYGHRTEKAADLQELYKNSRSEGFGPEVKRRIMSGTFVLSEGYYDAYYGKAQKTRRIIYDKTQEIFEKYDFILSPTTPTAAFNFGEKADDPIAMYLADILTVQANLAGTPAIALPIGKNEENMPLSIQLMANNFEEQKLFSFANHLEKISHE